MMKKQIKKDLEIWGGTFVRALSIVGLTFFSIAVTTGYSMDTLNAGVIAGGLYMFAELCKHYGVEPKHKRGEHHFLIFP